ncbi:rhomboid-like protein [Streptomyces sp. NPDC006711]|uniref:rhomboid-like protein n=1 Tax=unclassified Streptomyces TaxID=2593676 RepID=UPI0036C0349C
MPWSFALLAAVASLTYGGNHAVAAWASTNLANMGDHPVEALIASTFLFGADPWACLRGIALVGLVLAFLVVRFGDLRAIALIAAGQVLGTLASEGLLAARIAAGEADPALRATLDVGPSYVMISALAAVVTAGARPWHRWVALAALAVRAPHLTSGLTALGVAPVGHVTALAGGVLLAWGLRSSEARHRHRHPASRGRSNPCEPRQGRGSTPTPARFMEVSHCEGAVDSPLTTRGFASIILVLFNSGPSSFPGR